MCAQLCPTLCDPMDCNPPGSTVHGILQARILDWLAIFSSRGSSWPRDWTHVFCVSYIGMWILYHMSLSEAHKALNKYKALLLLPKSRNAWTPLGFCGIKAWSREVEEFWEWGQVSQTPQVGKCLLSASKEDLFTYTNKHKQAHIHSFNP